MSFCMGTTDDYKHVKRTEQIDILHVFFFRFVAVFYEDVIQEVFYGELQINNNTRTCNNVQ